MDELKAAKSADQAWIDGARFGWNCGVLESRKDFDAAIEARRKQIAEVSRIAEDGAPEVYDVWKEAANG